MKLPLLVLRWIARAAALFVVVSVLIIFVAYAVRNELPNPSQQTAAELIVFWATILMNLGLIIAWKWEGAGGAVTLISFAVYWRASGAWPGWFIDLTALVGLLFLICRLLDRREPKTSPR